MTDINTVTVMGRLTKDGKLSYTKAVLQSLILALL